MQVGNSTISRPPLVIDEYRFAESRAAHPPAFEFCRTWDQSRSSSSCSPVPHFGGLQTSPSPNRGWVYCSSVNILDIKPVHHDSWQVAAEYTTPSARQSLPRQEPDLRVLLYQNQKELSVWQATTESCRATPSREQPPSQGHDPPTCQSSPMSCRPSGGGCTCWLFPAGTPTAQP